MCFAHIYALVCVYVSMSLPALQLVRELALFCRFAHAARGHTCRFLCFTVLISVEVLRTLATTNTLNDSNGTMASVGHFPLHLELYRVPVVVVEVVAFPSRNFQSGSEKVDVVANIAKINASNKLNNRGGGCV